MSNHRNRKDLRIRDYDYSQNGFYFVTLLAYNKECLFGKICNGKTVLNGIGEIVHLELKKSEIIREELTIDQFCIMPNHIHAIIVIHDVGANGRSPLHKKKEQKDNRSNPEIRNRILKPRSLSSFIAGFKSSSTKIINIIRKTPKQKVWQRNFYDHVIRSEKELFEIRKYIIQNPIKWELDRFYK